jgi:hypothetical protein
MGADWYSPIVFFGIAFPLDKVKAFLEELGRRGLATPFQTTLHEAEKHSRCEGEDVSDLLSRCSGFFGYVDVKATPRELVEHEARLVAFLEEHASWLEPFDIKGAPALMAGFEVDLEYLDY